VAGGGQGPDEGGLLADINVTPLVDITLVLLIIFMVAAPLIVSVPSIKVDLPKAATGEETGRVTLALTLQRQPAGGSRLYLNGAPGDDEAVRRAVPPLLSRDRDLQAVIAADQGVAYGDVVHVVDLVRSLGVRKFALDTEPVR
jgi:biopolymer transport protein TolR